MNEGKSEETFFVISESKRNPRRDYFSGHRPRFPLCFADGGGGSLTARRQLGQNQLDSGLVRESVSMSR